MICDVENVFVFLFESLKLDEVILVDLGFEKMWLICCFLMEVKNVNRFDVVKYLR